MKHVEKRIFPYLSCHMDFKPHASILVARTKKAFNFSHEGIKYQKVLLYAIKGQSLGFQKITATCFWVIPCTSWTSPTPETLQILLKFTPLIHIIKGWITAKSQLENIDPFNAMAFDNLGLFIQIFQYGSHIGFAKSTKIHCKFNFGIKSGISSFYLNCFCNCCVAIYKL